MDVKGYVLTVTAAALMCGIVTKLTGKEGAQHQLIQMAAGLVLLFAVIQPFAKLQWKNPADLLQDLQLDASDAVQEGVQQTNQALAQSIKEQTRAYILDKAAALGADAQVEVLMSEDTLPAPVGVIITGDVSPYVKVQLSNMMEKDLGISGENQIWK